MKKIFLILALLFLTGCLPQKPLLTYQKTDILPENFRTVLVRNYYEITNPNAMTLQGKLSYSLSVEKRQLFAGRSQAIESPGKTTSSFYVDTVIDLPEAVGSSAFLLEDLQKGKESLAYEIKGSYSTSFAGIPFDLPLNIKGNIPLPKLPEIKLTALKIKNLSLSSLELAVVANVINNNNFELPLNYFIYNLKIDGLTLTENPLQKDTVINSGGAKDIALNLKIDLNKTDRTLLEQIKNGSGGSLNLEKINF